MKIKTTNGETIDTKKLSDKEAEVSEAVNNLFEVCKRYNCSLLTKVIISDTKYIGAENQMIGPKGEESMDFMFNLLNYFCMEKTGGQVRLVKLSDDKIDEDNPFE